MVAIYKVEEFPGGGHHKTLHSSFSDGSKEEFYVGDSTTENAKIEILEAYLQKKYGSE